jgi:hypothetical protein
MRPRPKSRVHATMLLLCALSQYALQEQPQGGRGAYRSAGAHCCPPHLHKEPQALYRAVRVARYREA